MSTPMDYEIAADSKAPNRPAKAEPVAFTIELASELRAKYLDERTVKGDGDDDCWLWTLRPDRDGYGVATFDRKQWRAHRLSYTHHVGPIPDAMDLDHSCEVRLCVRPSHLSPMTNFDNFVHKYLRQGFPRDRAEELAKVDLSQIARRQAEKVIARGVAARHHAAVEEAAARDRAAVEKAAEVGIVEGALVRRGNGPAVWKVKFVAAGGGERVYVGIEATASGYSIMTELDTLTFLKSPRPRRNAPKPSKAF